MADFDPQTYFANRLQEANRMEMDNSIRNQFQEMQASRERTAKQIEVDIAAKEKQKELNKNSWVSKLDLDPESAAGIAINASARFISGASGLVGNTLSAEHAIGGYLNSAFASQDDLDAFSRISKGVASDEDIARLTRTAPGGNDSVLNRLLDTQRQYVTANKINKTFDISSIANTTNTDTLREGLKQAWNDPDAGARMAAGWDGLTKGDVTLKNTGDAVLGAGNTLAGGVKALLNNKAGVLDLVAENAPQLALAALGPAGIATQGVSNVGMAMDTFNKGISNYQKANNGAMPSPDRQREMFADAMKIAASEQLSDTITAGAGKVFGKLAKGSAEEVSKEAARTSFKQALLHTGKATAESAATEGATEAYQQSLESRITTGKEATGEDLFVAGMMGAAAGAGLGAGARALHEGAQLVAQAPAPKEKSSSPEIRKLAEEGIKSGDVSGLVDPANVQTYAPDRAIAALFGHTQANPSSHAENVIKADSIMEALVQQRDAVRGALMGKDDVQAELDQAIKERDALPADDPDGLKEVYNLTIEGLTEKLKEPEDEANIANNKKALANLESLIQSAEQNYSELQRLGKTTEINEEPSLDQLVSEVESSTPETSKPESVDQIISLAMANPDSLDAVTAQRLADNSSNGLTDDQRESLRTFSESRIAANRLRDMGGVSQEIFEGSKENLGIRQYMARMADAIKTNNSRSASRTLRGIQDFLDGHSQKAARAQEALNEGSGTRIIRTNSGSWKIGGDGLTKKQLRSNGGLEVRSQNLVDSILTEADALQKAVDQLQAAYKQKFGSAAITPLPTSKKASVASPAATADASQQSSNQEVNPEHQPEAAAERKRKAEVKGINETKEIKNVQNPSQQGSVQEASKSQGTEVQADETTGVRKTAEGVVGDATSQRSNMEDAGVTGKANEDDSSRVSSDMNLDGRGSASSVKSGSTEKNSVSSSTTVKESNPEDNTTTAKSREGELSERGDAAKGTVAADTSYPTQKKSINNDNTSSGGKPLDASDVVSEQQPSTESPEGTHAGQLQVLSQKSPASTEFKKRNLIADFFKQVVGKDGDASQRPLVAVKDFLSSMTKESVMDFLAQEKLDEKQTALLKMFKGKATAWAEAIKKNLPPRSAATNPEFFYTDLMQFFVQGTGNKRDIEQNVKTAIAYAAFSWIAENASRNTFNGPDDINAILGRDEGTPVSSLEQSILGHVGSWENVVRNSLGRKVVQALGLKANKGAPKNLLPTLEAVLGGHTAKLLEDLGVLQRTALTVEEAKKLFGEENYNGAVLQFMSLNREGKGLTLIQDIKTATIGTQSVLDRLFGVEAGLKEPSFNPIPFKQVKVKNTDRGVPTELAKIIEQENAVPSYVQRDMHKFASVVAPEIFLEIAGAEHVEDANGKLTKHAFLARKAEAKNDGLQREFESFMAFVNEMFTDGKPDLGKAMYFDHVMWKPQRVGIATNVVNPQSSKIHRHLLYRQAWDTKVDLADAAQMENFFLRVGEGMGVKTDKKLRAKALEEAQTKRESQEVQAAVDALVRVIQAPDMTPMPQEDQQAVLAGVRQAGEDMHSLSALMALAQMKVAQAAGEASFSTQLMGEVDGVTNGPMLSHWLFGAANSADELFGFLNRGGFFKQDDAFTQYNEFRGTPGNLDFYEITISKVLDRVQQLKGSPLLASVYAFTGILRNEEDRGVTSKGRNIIKTPLTAMVFGSSIKKSVSNMADDFVESIYSAIERTNANEAGSMSTEELVKHINTLLNKPSIALPREMNIRQLMTMEFSAEQIASIKQAFTKTLGQAVTETMKTEFNVFIERRSALNTSAQTTFMLYDAIKSAMRQQVLQEQMDLYAKDKTQGIAWTSNKEGKKLPLHGLTVAQESEIDKELSKILPVMHTPMSKASGELRNGLAMSKSATRSSEDPTYHNQIKFGTKTADGSSSARVRGVEQIDAAPGVAMGVLSTHSTDTAIMHTSLGNSQALNIHDAKGVGVGGAQEAAQSLNKATFETILNYSPMREAHNALLRTVHGLHALVSGKDVAPEVKENISTVLQKLADIQSKRNREQLSADEVLQRLIEDSAYHAGEADRIRLEAATIMEAVDQYAFDGGNYKVTDDNRVAAQELLHKIETALDPRDLEVVEEISKALNGTTPATPNADLNEGWDDVAEQVQEANVAEKNSSVFGAIGQSNVPSDPRLVELLSQPNANAGAVIRGLYSLLKEDVTALNRNFSMELLRRIRPLIGASLTVKMITPDTQESEVTGGPRANSFGWFQSSDGGKTGSIYVLGPEFVGSGITPELLLHELVHAALAKAIRSNSPEAKKAVAELENLRSIAERFINEKGLTQFSNAVANVDELVSWGMTNQAFQQQVLAQIKVPAKKNAFIKGMNELVRVLGNLLGFTKTEDMNSLGLLIANVSSLMEVAQEQTNNTQDKDIDLEISLGMQTNWFVQAKEKFAALVDKFIRGQTDPKESHEILNQSPVIMQKLGLPNLPVRIGDHGLESVYNHGVKPSQMKQVLDELANPRLVMIWNRGRNNETSLNFVTSMSDSQGNPFVIAIQPNKAGREGKHHWLATITPRNPTALLSMVRDGGALYVGEGEIAGVASKELQQALSVARRERGKEARDLKAVMASKDGLPNLVQQTLYSKDLTEDQGDGSVSLPMANEKRGKESRDRMQAMRTEYGLPNLVQNVLYAKDVKDEDGSISLSMAHVEAIDKYTTTDIYEALGNGSVSPGFDEHLRGLLNGIVQRLHGPFGSLFEAARKTEAGNPLAVWLKAVETGKAPFASQIIGSPLSSSPQEDFVAEQVDAVVRAALDNHEASTSFAYREFGKLWQEARLRIKPKDFFTGDWNTASPNEKAIAQEKYDFVFKMWKTDGERADYLSRFAALGLANQEFRKLLAFDTKKVAAQPKTFLERLSDLFEKFIGFFGNKLNNTYAGQPVDAKMQALVDRLVSIEAKKRNALQRQASSTNLVAPIESGVRDVVHAAKDKLVEVAGSKFFRENGNAFVRATAAAARLVANNKVDAFMDALGTFRDKQFDEKDGFLASLIREVKHPDELLKKMLLQTKRNEQLRKDMIAHTSKFALQSFLNEGKDLTKEAKNSITAMFMRTGAHHLLGQFSMKDIEGMVTDPAEMNKAIAGLEKQLSSKHAGWMIVQAKALGYYKATGNTKSSTLLMNAHNIASLFGTGLTVETNTGVFDANVQALNSLIALYSMKYSESLHSKQALQVLQTENTRSDGQNGVEFILGLHKKMEQEALERSFGGNPTLMMHGYTPEIYNPHTEIKVATNQEGKDLLYQGYRKVGELDRDSRDTGQRKELYVLKDGGMLPWLSGVLSMTGMRNKGSEVEPQSMIYASNTAMVKVSMAQANAFDPQSVQENFAAPILNENGDIVDWRYLMREHVKDSILERENRFDQVIGTLAGSVFDKPVAKDQNNKVIEALHEQYQDEFAKTPERFIHIGAKSNDPELRELWAMLPQSTRNAIRETWGESGMSVRKDAVDIVFGYRKLSAATMFKKVNEERQQRRDNGLPTSIHQLDSVNAMQKLFVASIETALMLGDKTRGISQDEAERRAARAAVLVARGERVWQEVVKEAKDLIVVKTSVVLLGNIWSNLSLLGLHGVPMKDIVKNHYVALRGAVAYKRDKEVLDRLRAFRDTGYTQGNDDEIQREITRLEDALDRNPVRELIDAGLMPSIVEDMGAEEDVYSYKSLLTRKVERYTSHLNPGVMKVAKGIYMTHDTKAYQILSQITQLSDFVARYTLYQHMTNRAVDPLSKDEAMQRASDAFVNYDLPMHRALQYTDDMGFTMFTKYFMRIQKELGRLFMEQPARVLAMVAGSQFMDLGPTILESHWGAHIGNNPIESGAFKYLYSLDDLATIAAPIALLK